LELQVDYSGHHQLRILDVGCETGHLSSEIPHPRYLVGDEASKETIKSLRHHTVHDHVLKHDKLFVPDAVAYLRATESQFDIFAASSSVQFFTPTFRGIFEAGIKENFSPE